VDRILAGQGYIGYQAAEYEFERKDHLGPKTRGSLSWILVTFVVVFRIGVADCVSTNHSYPYSSLMT